MFIDVHMFNLSMKMHVMVKKTEESRGRERELPILSTVKIFPTRLIIKKA